MEQVSFIRWGKGTDLSLKFYIFEERMGSFSDL